MDYRNFEWGVPTSLPNTLTIEDPPRNLSEDAQTVKSGHVPVQDAKF